MIFGKQKLTKLNKTPFQSVFLFHSKLFKLALKEF